MLLCIGILLLYFKYKYKTPHTPKNEFEPQYEHSITKAVDRLQFPNVFDFSNSFYLLSAFV